MRILFACLGLVIAVTLQAQDIKVKGIRKLKVDTEVQDYSFARTSHRIILETAGSDRPVEYNTRTRRSRTYEGTVREAEPEWPVTAKAAGRKIRIVESGKEDRFIAPLGEVLYIWISLSPDAQHLLFKAVGRGVYICDLEGNIVRELGDMNAPAWMDGGWILGMDDRDDGHRVISSDIMAVHAASGTKKNLSEGSGIIAMYPKASPDADRIIFRNESGEAYTMKIKIKE